MREPEAQVWMGWGARDIYFGFINLMVTIEVIGVGELTQGQYLG